MGIRDRRLISAEMGYGNILEVPSPCYGQGLAMGLLYPWVTCPAMVLKQSLEDVNTNYRRAQIFNRNLGEFRFDPYKCDPKNPEELQPVRHHELEKIVPLTRGRISFERLEAARAESPMSDDSLAVIAYCEFLTLLNSMLKYNKNWNLSFYQWILQKPPGEYRDGLERVMRRSLFDYSVSSHRKVFAGRVESWFAR